MGLSARIHNSCFTVQIHYEIFRWLANTFIRDNHISMPQKELCGNHICTARRKSRCPSPEPLVYDEPSTPGAHMF